jgi:trehalose monomycolate/heme transporter
MPEQRPRQPHPGPGDEPTNAIPAQRPRTLGTPPEGRGDADSTAAIPAQRQPDPDATEKLEAREEDEKPKRRGGGMSAQDLLRREGRL